MYQKDASHRNIYRTTSLTARNFFIFSSKIVCRWSRALSSLILSLISGKDNIEPVFPDSDETPQKRQINTIDHFLTNY